MKQTFCIGLLLICGIMFSFKGADSVNILQLIKKESENPQKRERVYLQLDKSLYQPGDTLWVKGYSLDNHQLNLSAYSSSMFIHLLNENGEIVQDAKLLLLKGEAIGQLILSEVLPEGFYQLVAYSSFMKNFPDDWCFSKKIQVRKFQPGDNNLAIGFEQKDYKPGDTIVINAKLVDQEQAPLRKKRLSARLFLGEEEIESVKERTINDGIATFRVVLPTDLKGLDPYVSVSFNPNENEKISKEANVPVINEDIDLQFFPEGGVLLDSIQSRIAFKAIGNDGLPVEVKGVVVDEEGNKICPFCSLESGLGSFILRPHSGKKYKVHLSKPLVSHGFELPDLVSQGYGLSVLKVKNQEIDLAVQHNFTEKKTILLTMRLRGKTVYTVSGKVDNLGRIRIPTADMPAGVGFLTLFDEEGKPWAERLVFVNYDRRLHVDVKIPYDYFLRRQKVEANLLVRNEKGEVLPGVFSVSVVDSATAFSKWIPRDNILSSLLVEADLKGHIPTPEVYFDDTNPSKGKAMLDLMLMSNGYRRFQWLDELKTRMDSPCVTKSFDLIKGKVTKGKKTVPKANLYVLNFNGAIQSTFEADQQGEFIVNPLYQDRDVPELLFVASAPNGRKNIKLKLESGVDSLKYNFLQPKKGEINHWSRLFNPEVLSRSTMEDALFQIGDTRFIQEIIVKGIRKEPQSGFSAGNTKTVTGESLHEAAVGFVDYLRQVAMIRHYDLISGHVVMNDYSSLKTSLNTFQEDEGIGNSDDAPGVLFVVDGMEMGKNANDLDYLTKEEIKEIRVLKGNQGFFFYGDRGLYGVVEVTTQVPKYKEGEGGPRRLSNMAVTEPFLEPRVFYTPKYETNIEKSSLVPDLRTTIHWQPELRVDGTGKTSFSFYNGDMKGTMVGIIEGVSNDGYLGYKVFKYRVK